MVEPLTSLAVRKVPIEELVNYGFENLPQTHSFWRSLALSIDPNLPRYYDRRGDWGKFMEDLAFLLNNESQAIDYMDTMVYWSRKHDHNYNLIIASVRGWKLYHIEATSLNEVMARIFNTLIKHNYDISQGTIGPRWGFNDLQGEIYDCLAGNRQALIDDLLDHLNTGGLIEIEENVTSIFIYFLENNYRSYVCMDNDGSITVIGLYSLRSDREIAQTYSMRLSNEDARRFLVILAMNINSIKRV